VVLSRLLAAVGIAALQVDLFRMRLLHVLLGLLLAAGDLTLARASITIRRAGIIPILINFTAPARVAAGTAFR
jgi:hypothetical protein